MSVSTVVKNPAETGKVGYKHPPLETRFKAGNLANPGGKPVRARNSLNAAFLNALLAEFNRSGKAAIKACAKEDPARFVTILASLLPKELEISHPLDEFTDEQLDAAAETIRTILAAQGYRPDEIGQGGAQPAEKLPALPAAG
ncbi:MAG: hypothetical protein U1A72_11695 [Sulfuritalea sp.]|nr:hypothetical protein [Sulfuritalea sp.]